MKKSLVFFLLALPCLAYAGNNAWFSDYRDPKTGILDTDKMMADYAVPEGRYPVHHDDEVTSIDMNGDHRLIITFKDGSKKVFEKDVFNPRRGWKQVF